MTAKELKHEIHKWCIKNQGKAPSEVHMPRAEFEDLIKNTGDKGSLKWFETDTGQKLGIWLYKTHVFSSNRSTLEIL